MLSLPLAAQVGIGSEVQMTANGDISAGYNGSYGNDIDSSHGIGVGGAAALNGFFYNPNFLSFNVNPYYNQSRTNSSNGSISDASGVSLSTSIFGGSHFPGSVNYAAAWNSSGNYGIPGISSLNTNGNNQNFGINWNELVPGLPTLSVGYQRGNSNYYLYGTNESGNSAFNSFYASSNYNLHGFALNGGVSHSTSDSLIPGIIFDGETATTNADNTTYVATVSHTLPWQGNFVTNFNRTDLNSDYLGYKFNGDIDIVNVDMSFHPTTKFSFSASGNYTDNFNGSLYEALVPGATGNSSILSQASSTSTTGFGGIDSTQSNQSSHAMDLQLNGFYAFATNFQLDGQIDRRQQSYSGADFGSTLYSVGVIYTRQIMGGYLGSSFNVVDSTIDTSSQNELGFNASANYTRRIGAWTVGAYANYAQNVQTLLIVYDTSFYNFSGNVSRQFGRWYWSAMAAGGRTGLTDQPDSSNTSENFGTTFGMRKFSFGGNYAKSNGNALASGGGLVPTPLPPIIPTDLLVLYGGNSLSLSASATPVRNFNVSASYVTSKTNLTNTGLTSWNNFKQQNVYFQYQFRQVGLNGGYTHLEQGFSASNTAPANFSSFYIGVYRWFNFF